MMTWVRRWLRAYLLRLDRADPSLPTDLPPSLEPFEIGESFPIKGTWLKVGKIIGGDFPMLILVPTGATRGRMLHVLRDFRDAGREHLAETNAIAGALKRDVH